jgi:hypothetical protein
MDITILHADHGVTGIHRGIIKDVFIKAGDGFLLKTVNLDDYDGYANLPLMSGIHGPIAGDPPVPADEIVWAKRGERPNLSRLCNRAPRPTLLMTVIGTREGEKVTVFTVYGGPCAPREITDPTLPAEAAEEAAQFWANHALSMG